MRLKDFDIRTQLILGFSAVIFSIGLLGYLAHNQGIELHKQIETLINQPLAVQNAIAEIEIDVLNMRLATRDLMLATTDAEKNEALQTTQKAFLDADRKFKILSNHYSDTFKNIDEAYDAFILWNNSRQKNLRLSLAGDIYPVKQSLKKEGDIAILRENMLIKIHNVGRLAKNRAIHLELKSGQLALQMRNHLIIICIILIVFSVLIVYMLIKNIRKPISEILHVISEYKSGNLLARSKNSSQNEIGLLALSFNEMLDKIKTETELLQKKSRISAAMLIEDNSHSFFKELLPVLATETNSQIAAVYLLNESKSEFELYESLGLTICDENKRFSSVNLEGEFGRALITKEICFVKQIPKDSVYMFNTVSGTIVPREIVTIPILIGRTDVVAIISLASLRSYSQHTIELFYRTFDVLTARIIGILAYRSIRKSTLQLKEQNHKLEKQRNELNQQSTELLQQNAELEIQKTQLKEASKLKTTFLSNMSHELRTPLNSVIALSGVLSRRLSCKIPDEEFSYIQVIQRNGKHLLSLINDILDISRIEAGKEDIEINKFTISDAITDVVEMIMPQAIERNIVLKAHLPEQKIELFTDKKKFSHILQNLIANAVKFTEQGKVEIFILPDNEKIKIQVKDTGIGISEENIKHIFDEFRQADGSTSRKFGGTGLGLAIAKKYAHLLKGEIEVESQLNVGSVFTLILPLMPTNTNTVVDYNNPFTKTNSIARNVKIPKTVERNILLVEDSEPAIIQIKDMLESNGYTVTAVSNGVMALEILNTFTPDAIILDLMMPQMDGFELLEKIRNFDKTKAVPVLILTAKHITKEDIKQLKNNNIHQLIQKGDVQKEELLHSVYSMVYDAYITPKIQTDGNNSSKNEFTNNGSKKSILIVEDNPDNMTTIKALLDNNFDVFEADNGQTGIEMAQKHMPDLILMDIALPKMDGIEAFKLLKANSLLQQIPVIAITASAMASEKELILSQGFDGYISKPIDDKSFFEIVNRVIYG